MENEIEDEDEMKIEKENEKWEWKTGSGDFNGCFLFEYVIVNPVCAEPQLACYGDCFPFSS